MKISFYRVVLGYSIITGLEASPPLEVPRSSCSLIFLLFLMFLRLLRRFIRNMFHM